MTGYNPKDFKIGYGRYKDTTIDEMPIYLIKKIANQKGHIYRMIALRELKRRREAAAKLKIRMIGK